MSKRSWNDSYPPIPPRPTGPDWPAWYHVPIDDLATFLAQSQIPADSIHSILDVGGGDGRRVMYALLNNAPLNREDVHVCTVDWAANAIVWGVDLWSYLRRSERPADFPYPIAATPKWSMCLREEDVFALPRDIRETQYDLVIDWMFLHGLSRMEARTYFNILTTLEPRYIVLKCFSTEGSSLKELPRAVNDVQKQQWSEAELIAQLGSKYELLGKPRQCAEDLRPLHPDGAVAAKREYCFARRSAHF